MNKKCTIFLVLLMGFSILVPGVVKYDMENNYIIESSDDIKYNDSSEIAFNIDRCEIDKYIEIQGWGMRLNEQIQVANTQIGFLDLKTNEIIIIPTVLEVRKDVNQEYKTKEFKYKNTGFYGKINSDIINMNHTYKIVLFFDANREYCYDTKKMISEGRFVNE